MKIFSRVKKRLLPFVMFVSCVLYSWTALAQPSNQGLTLSEAYALALKQSETVAIESEQIKEAEAHFRQALSGILPDISYVISERRQDGNGGNNFTLRKIPEQKFTLSQPLFSGFKEFNAMFTGRAEKRQSELELQHARQLLFIDVMDAFYLALNQQANLETLQTIRGVVAERVDELVKRQEIGRTRESEVASAQASLSQIEADIVELEKNRAINLNLLEFLTGTPIDHLIEEDVPGLPTETEQVYIEKAKNRPDVRAAKEAHTVAKKNVRIAQGDLLPTVTADGNYYTERVGNSASVEWDATLTVDIPLFQGGQILANVKERVAERKQAELLYLRTFRQAQRDIKDAWISYQSALKIEAALQKAVVATERNYDLQKKDYNSSLVDNLDVMNALEDLQTLRRRYIDSRTQSARSYWNFQIEIGESP